MINNRYFQTYDSNSIMIRLKQIKDGGKVTITHENISVFYEFKDNTSSFAQENTTYKREITYDELASLNSAIDLLSDNSLYIYTEYQKCFLAANKVQQNIQELYKFGKTFVYENYNFFDLNGKDQHINANLENLISAFSNYLEKKQIEKLKYPPFLTSSNLLYFGTLLQRKKNKKIHKLLDRMFQHNYFLDINTQNIINEAIHLAEKDEFIYDPMKCSIKMFSAIYSDMSTYFKYPSKHGSLNHKVLNNHFIKLQKEIQYYFSSHTFLIIKVDKTVETFHVLPIISVLLYDGPKRYPLFFEYFFCYEDSNIESYLNDIEGEIRIPFCFIIHPELLSPQNKSILKEKIISRVIPVPNLSLQKLVIITASEEFTFEQKPIRIGMSWRNEKQFLNEFCISVDVSLMRKYSTVIRHPFFDFRIIQSYKAGSGKSFYINQKIDKIAKRRKSKIFHHFIIDANQPFPVDSFKSFGNDIQNIIHFQFSDEIMKKGIKFWSYLYQLYFYGYVLPTNSGPISIDFCGCMIFFEIPQIQKNMKSYYPLEDLSQFPIPISIDYRLMHDDNEIENFEKTKLENHKCSQQFHIDENYIKYIELGIENVLKFMRINRSQHINLEDYLSIIFRRFFKMDNYFEVSFRKLSYIEKYLYKYTKLYFFSQPKNTKNIDARQMAVFFYSLTISSFYAYECFPTVKEKDQYRKGLIFLTVDDLFDDLVQNDEMKIHFYTTMDENEFFIFFDQENISTKNCSFSIDFNYSIGNDKFKPPQDILTDIFSTNDQYKKNVYNFKIKNPGSFISLTKITVPALFRLSVILNRIFLSQPIILSGDTGVGKTSSLMLLFEYFKIPLNKQNYSLSIEVGSILNCYPGTTIKNVEDHLKKASKSSKKHIIFFDELNTSPASPFIEHLILNTKQAYGTKFVFIGALNPYKYKNPISYNLTRIGLPQMIINDEKEYNLIEQMEYQKESENMSKMMYYVRPIQKATKDIIFDFNTICFYRNELDTDIFYPKEERDLIHLFIDSNIKYPEDDDERKVLLNFYKNSIDICIIFIRHLMNEKATISIRDIKRSVEIYSYLYQYILNVEMQGFTGHDVVLVTVIISFVLRLPNHQKVLEKDLRELNDTFREMFDHYFKKIGHYEYGSYDGASFTLDIRDKLLSIISKKESVDEIKKRFMKFVYSYTFKYIKDPKIWKFKSTFIHLFVMDICIHCKLPCFIIGVPGTSKSYAVELLQNHNKGKFHISTCMPSRISSPHGIKSQYYDVIYKEIEDKLEGKDDGLYAVFIDEMGNANINPSRPLKQLHEILDHGLSLNELGYSKMAATIGVSNYAMDFAIMNRGVLVYTDLPDINEMIRVFQYDEEKPNVWNAEEFMKKMDSIDKLKECKIKAIFQCLWPGKNDREFNIPSTIALRSVYNLRFLIDNNRFDYHDVCCILRELINSKRLFNEKGLYKDLLSQCPRNVVINYIDRIEFSKINNIFCFLERIADERTKSNKSLSIFTQNYEVLEYFSLFLDEGFIQYLNAQFNRSLSFSATGFSDFKYFLFAENFKDKPEQISQFALEKIKECIISKKQNILLVGNHPCFDSCMDLLNVPHSKEMSINKSREVILGSCFSLKFTLTNLKFYFIMIANISDIINKDIQRNPFVFLNRTEALYLDWEMISEYYLPYKLSPNAQRKRSAEEIYQKIQETLKDHIAYETKGNDYLHTDIQYLYEYLNYDPKYMNADFGDECLNELINERWEKGFRAVILTKSKILEDLYYPEKFNCQQCRLIINDTNLQNIEELHKLIMRKQGKEILIIIKCSKFVNLHFAHLKSFFDRNLANNRIYHVFIVYFGCDPKEFTELSTFRWPILSMEDISKHPELEDHMTLAQTYILKKTLEKMDEDFIIDSNITNTTNNKNNEENADELGREEEEEEFEMENENNYKGVCDKFFNKLFDIIVKFTEKDIQERARNKTLAIKKDYNESSFKKEEDYFYLVKQKIHSFTIDIKESLQTSLKSQIISSVYQRLSQEIAPFLLFVFGPKSIKVYENSRLIDFAIKSDLQLPFNSYLNHGELNYDVFHYLFLNYVEFLIQNQVSFDKDMIQRKYIADRVISLLNNYTMFRVFFYNISSSIISLLNDDKKVQEIFPVIMGNFYCSDHVICYIYQLYDKDLQNDRGNISFQLFTDALRLRSFAGINIKDYSDFKNYWSCYFTSSLFPNDENDKSNSGNNNKIINRETLLKDVLSFRNQSIFEIFQSPIVENAKSQLKETKTYANICKHMISYYDLDSMDDKVYQVFKDFQMNKESLKSEERLEYIKKRLNSKSISDDNRKLIASMLCFYILNKWESNKHDDIKVDLGHIPAIHHLDYTFYDTKFQANHDKINDAMISKFADVYVEQYDDFAWNFSDELNGSCLIDAIQSVLGQKSTVKPKFRKWLLSGFEKGEPLAAAALRRCLKHQSDEAKADLARIVDPFFGDQRLADYFIKNAKSQISKLGENELFPFNQIAHDDKVLACITYKTIFKLPSENSIFGLKCANPSVAQFIWFHVAFSDPKRYPLVTLLIKESSFFTDFHAVPRIINAVLHLRHLLSYNPALIPIVLHCTTLFRNDKLQFLFDLDCFNIEIEKTKVFDKIEEDLETLKEVLATEYKDEFTKVVDKTSYEQINFILSKYFRRYNNIMTNISKKSKATPVKVATYSILPNMLITNFTLIDIICPLMCNIENLDDYKEIEKSLARLFTAKIYHLSEEMAVGSVKATSFPLITVILDDNEGKDFLGFSKSDYKYLYQNVQIISNPKRSLSFTLNGNDGNEVEDVMSYDSGKLKDDEDEYIRKVRLNTYNINNFYAKAICTKEKSFQNILQLAPDFYINEIEIIREESLY